MINRLYITGSVHNQPTRIITSYHSFPKGKTKEECMGIIDEFAKAFDFKMADWYTGL